MLILNAESLTAHNVYWQRYEFELKQAKCVTAEFFYCRGGEHFERLKELTQHEDSNALIFSIDGEETLSKRTVLYHFHKIVELAEIKDREERDLVPYSPAALYDYATYYEWIEL